MVDENKYQNNPHADSLNRELEWLARIFTHRFAVYFGHESQHQSVFEIDPPDHGDDPGYYGKFIRVNDLNFEERLLLILALTPHLDPVMLDPLGVKNPDTDRPFTEFGGNRGQMHSGYLPTGQTVSFLLDEAGFANRIELYKLFDEDHLFSKKNILNLALPPDGEPYLSGILNISKDFLDQVMIGKYRYPRFGSDFPAKIITTPMEWDDLILEGPVRNHLTELLNWLDFSDTLMEDWGLKRKVKPGFRSLFYGPPGTGKTLTASLLGKRTGKPVFRIDLSMVVSKYIGETEKNLGRVFSAAENKDWILFFDEADALFGKRTKVSDSHDRYANQEVSYLLQRVEDYDGLVILASNLKSNIDDAFIRRFQSIIHFPMPSPAERFAIWKSGFSIKSKLARDLDLGMVAEKYELSGGAIINAIQHASLRTITRGDNEIGLRDVMAGIRKEFSKEGKSM